METINVAEILEGLAGMWAGFAVLHFLSHEQSPGRRFLLKIFARWIEVPLLWFIWVACQGPLKFLTANRTARALLGKAVTRPFALWIDTGVPIPTKDVLKLLDLIDGPIAAGRCRCDEAKKTCDHPERRDIVFRTGAEAWLWAFPHDYEVIEKEEARRIILDCSERDMFQMIFIHCSAAHEANEYVLCNCCECGCKVHLVNRTMGQEYFPLRDGGFRSRHDPAKCEACGTCVEKCPFQAIRLEDGKVTIEECFGCGVCERVCERGAFIVERVHGGPPWAQDAWRLLDNAGQ